MSLKALEPHCWESLCLTYSELICRSRGPSLVGTGSHENQGARRSQQAASLQVPVFLLWDHRVLSIAHCLGDEMENPKSEAQGHLQLDRNSEVDLALREALLKVKKRKEKGRRWGEAKERERQARHLHHSLVGLSLAGCRQAAPRWY